MTSTIVANGSFLDLSGIISFDTIEVQGTTANTDLIPVSYTHLTLPTICSV